MFCEVLLATFVICACSFFLPSANTGGLRFAQRHRGKKRKDKEFKGNGLTAEAL